MRINVVPNPWLALDAKGRPCAVVPVDFEKHSQNRRWVGADLMAVETRKQETQRVGKHTQVTVEARHEHRWKFATSPVAVPISDYYIDRLRRGELLPGDEECARSAGVPFVSPDKTLASAKAAAVSVYDGQHGEGAWASANGSETASRAAPDGKKPPKQDVTAQA